MLTASGAALLTTALGLAGVGVALGNYELLLLASFPLFLLLSGTGSTPGAAEVARRLRTRDPRRGDEVAAEVEVRLPPGSALVEVHQGLPEAFPLTGGSNLHLLATREDGRHAVFRFRFRAAKRGAYVLPAPAYEVVSPLGLEAPEPGTAGEPEEVTVRPRFSKLARVRGGRVADRAELREADGPRLGVATTEYLEVREYAWGDPPSTVNWKATAKRLEAGERTNPLVNEFEREGKRSVFVLLDADERMRVGTTVDHGFDHAIEAATGVAAYFLDRGYRVGGYAFNARDGAEVLYPDGGEKQFRRLSESFARSVPGPPSEGLPRALERCEPHLREGSPYVVLVTRLGVDSAPLERAVAMLRAITGARRRRVPLLVVALRPLSLVPAETPHAPTARLLVEALERPAEATLRRAGADVLSWDPAEETFAHVFLHRGRPGARKGAKRS